MVRLLGRVISPSQGLYLHRTTQHRKTRDKYACLERDSNPQSQQPTGQDPRLRPHGHFDQLFYYVLLILPNRLVHRELRLVFGNYPVRFSAHLPNIVTDFPLFFQYIHVNSGVGMIRNNRPWPPPSNIFIIVPPVHVILG
jgi:hypothetical protein